MGLCALAAAAPAAGAARVPQRCGRGDRGARAQTAPERPGERPAEVRRLGRGYRAQFLVVMGILFRLVSWENPAFGGTEQVSAVKVCELYCL